MAEALISGQAQALRIGYDYGFVKIFAGNIAETFIIWSGPSSASARIVQSLQLSLLREALSQRIQVSILHEEDSALIKELSIAVPPQNV